MHRYRFIVLVLALVVGSPLAAKPCDVGIAGLDDLLDQVLPIHRQPVWRNGERKILSVRHTPLDASTGESLVTLVERDDGSVTATARRLRRGLSALADTVVVETPGLDCATLVERITVDEVRFEGAGLVRMRQLHKRLARTKIRADVSGDIQLDTAKYEFAVTGGSEELTLTLFPASKEGGRTHPVVLILSDVIRAASGEFKTRESRTPQP